MPFKPSFQHVFMNVYVCVSVVELLAEINDKTHRQMKRVKRENVMTRQCKPYRGEASIVCTCTNDKKKNEKIEKVKYSHCIN